MKRLLRRLIEDVQAGRINSTTLTNHRVPIENIPDISHILTSKLDCRTKPVLLPNGL